MKPLLSRGRSRSNSPPFDPYHKWLSIPPEDQPANFYRLLGLKQFEANSGVVSSAADRQMTHVRSFSGGPKGGIAQRVLNVLSSARIMLLDPNRKTAYDAMLRAAAADAEQSQTQIAKSPPPETKGNTFGDYVILHVISTFQPARSTRPSAEATASSCRSRSFRRSWRSLRNFSSG